MKLRINPSRLFSIGFSIALGELPPQEDLLPPVDHSPAIPRREENAIG
jgi:hypothetical protein